MHRPLNTEEYNSKLNFAKKNSLFTPHFICVQVFQIDFRLMHYMRSASSPLLACPDKLQSASHFSALASLFFQHVSPRILFFAGAFKSPFIRCLKFSTTDWRVNLISKNAQNMSNTPLKTSHISNGESGEYLCWQIGLGSKCESYLDWKGESDKVDHSGQCPFIFRSQWQLSHSADTTWCKQLHAA